MRLRNWNRLIVCACALGAALAATAQDVITLEPKQHNNVTFVSGGVGKDEADLAKAIGRHGYNLQLVFAEASGAFLADVGLHITDASGATVLETVSEGPMFLAKLPPGRYQVAAQVNGEVRKATVDATGGPKRTTLVWPASPGSRGGADTLPRG